LNILGSSASNTIVDGRAAGTVVTVSNVNAKVSITNLTIRNGFANSGGGLSNNGTVTISNSVVSGNVAKGLIAGGRWRRNCQLRHSNPQFQHCERQYR
jgi:hypothetical protein